MDPAAVVCRGDDTHSPPTLDEANDALLPGHARSLLSSSASSGRNVLVFFSQSPSLTRGSAPLASVGAAGGGATPSSTGGEGHKLGGIRMDGPDL